MKIDIGPYTNYIGPYQIAEKILFWKDKHKFNDANPTESHPDANAIDKLGEFLDSIPGLTNLCTWIESKRKRKVKIHVDNYDVWSADNTLAMIIHPVLVKLKKNKCGSPHVDNEDVPEALHAPAGADPYQTDIHWQARWDYVLDEMIWAFEQHANPDWEELFYSGKSDLNWDDGTLKKGPNDTFKMDMDGRELHMDRMENGRHLFAKYYFGLWD